ncbi:hypothetical protein PsorP6_009264 [Peronosclerospora sorghi]|uniref:Uncharacterized protein n=1 Tax=Peronosclerospora sorghi TaxID=230839 RepID=A0ACC0W011_9STRA|nr:hypothetical protein PsorP6_009264 [Peronosclerospora sorghi]
MLAWKPRTFSVHKKSTQRRAPTATSELSDSSDDMSETESSESTHSRAPTLRRLHSCPATEPHKATPMESQPFTRPKLKSVYSFARAGLLSVKPRQGGPKTPTSCTSSKSRSYSVEEDVVAPDVPVKALGTRVSTGFGLGKIAAIRHEDGVAAIELQTTELLYLNAVELDKADVVPALLGERVHTLSGSGYVVKYDRDKQLYTLQLGAGGDIGEYELELEASHVRLAECESEWGSEPRSPCVEHGSNVEVRRRHTRLSSVCSASSLSGLTLLKSLANTSYTFVASKYHQGQPVITKFGAGHIVCVNPQRSSAQIQLVWGVTAYLNADMIEYYPKVLAGTDVQTKFGAGVVTAVRPADAIYTVRLHDMQPVGKSNVVYVHESDLHRSRRIAVTAANVRDKLKAMAQRRFGERIVVDHQGHDEEPNSAGI